MRASTALVALVHQPKHGCTRQVLAVTAPLPTSVFFPLVVKVLHLPLHRCGKVVCIVSRTTSCPNRPGLSWPYVVGLEVDAIIILNTRSIRLVFRCFVFYSVKILARSAQGMAAPTARLSTTFKLV